MSNSFGFQSSVPFDWNNPFMVFSTCKSRISYGGRFGAEGKSVYPIFFSCYSTQQFSDVTSESNDADVPNQPEGLPVVPSLELSTRRMFLIFSHRLLSGAYFAAVVALGCLF